MLRKRGTASESVKILTEAAAASYSYQVGMKDRVKRRERERQRERKEEKRVNKHGQEPPRKMEASHVRVLSSSHS